MQPREATEPDFSTSRNSGDSFPAAKDVIDTTACPAFRIDPDGVILAWNDGAAELFGSSAEVVMGRACHDVVAGRDVFGNRFCDGSCPVRNMARRGEPVHHFLMDVRHSGGTTVRTGCCTLVERGRDSLGIVHIVQALDGAEGAPSRPEGDAARPAETEASFLTPRETEVLTLLDRGEPTRDMADRMGISVTTVRNHIQGILRKLGAHSRLEAVSLARRHGLL